VGRARKFSTTRLQPGYVEEEVDAFLDTAELRLAAQLVPGPTPPGGGRGSRHDGYTG
jgi:DivIVA domain-containing protein